MKFHWGHGIAIFFSLFVLFMLSLLYMSRQENIDLVTEEYYAEELKYENRLVQIRNSNDANLSIVTQLNDSQVILQFPEQLSKSNKLKGTVVFYRPSDAALDLSKDLVLSDEGYMVIDRSEFSKGLYEVQVEFEMDDTPYYLEKKIHL